MRDLYAVLQVRPEASDAEIKSAFRNLAKACHPDVCPGDREAEQTFKEARRAYQYLSHPETRKIYDDYLAARRAAVRARRRRTAATMSASFLLTTATIVLVALWMQRHSPSLDHLFPPASAQLPMEHAAAAGSPAGHSDHRAAEMRPDARGAAAGDRQAPGT